MISENFRKFLRSLMGIKFVGYKENDTQKYKSEIMCIGLDVVYENFEKFMDTALNYFVELFNTEPFILEFYIKITWAWVFELENPYKAKALSFKFDNFSIDIWAGRDWVVYAKINDLEGEIKTIDKHKEWLLNNYQKIFEKLYLILG